MSAIRKFGNSVGVLIPKPLLAEFGAEAGDTVALKIEGGRLVIERLENRVRQGWAENARRIAASNSDALEWPEFGKEADSALKG